MNPLVLDVAGIRVGVHCGTESLIDRLASRFRGFIGETGDCTLDVQIHLDLESAPHTHISPEFSFEDGRVFFDLPGYVGFIDPERAAVLRIASQTPANGVEYFLRVVYALLAFRADGLMVHGAGIVRAGRAYLFFGHSGSGKTTVARNSPEGLVLNDDLVILMPEENAWRAYGTPFSNPTQNAPSAESAPLAALLRLVQHPRVYAAPLTGAQAVAELLASVPILNGLPGPPLDRCQDILRQVPAYHLYLLPDDSFWPVVEKLSLHKGK